MMVWPATHGPPGSWHRELPVTTRIGCEPLQRTAPVRACKTHSLRAVFGRYRSCACRNILQAHRGDAFQDSSPTQGPLSGGPVFSPMEGGSNDAERYYASPN